MSEYSGTVSIRSKAFEVSYWDISRGDDIKDHYITAFLEDKSEMPELMSAFFRGENKIFFALYSQNQGTCYGEGEIVGLGNDGVEITNLVSFLVNPSILSLRVII